MHVTITFSTSFVIMEFFEKAHASTGSSRKKNSEKESKSQNTLKKQIGQMLSGYKRSDNNLIKNSTNIKTDLDDSTSVSGFSDLNLTNSSIEDDITQDTASSNTNNISINEFQDLSLSQFPNEHEHGEAISQDSISEFIEADSSASLEVHNSLFETSKGSSIGSSFMTTSNDSESDNMELFDPDGTLAAKILENLGKVEMVNAIKVKKRKLKEKGNIESSKWSSKDKHEKQSYRPKCEPHKLYVDDTSNYKDPKRFVEIIKHRRSLKYEDLDSSDPLNIVEQLNTSEDSYEQSIKSDVTDQSLLYVSIMAADMPSQSLSDVVGKYKHSTVKNLPSDCQNVIHSTDNSGMFCTEDMDFDNNTTIEEDVNSSLPRNPSIPDIDHDHVVDNLSDIINTSTSMPNDKSSICEDTMQSQESEPELSIESIEDTLVNPVKIYYGKNSCIFVLKHPAEIYIHGNVRVKALGGTVEVSGHTLKDVPYEVYAPNYNFAQYIRTVEIQNPYYGLFGKLTSSGLSVAEAEDIVTTLGENDGVISLQMLRSRKMDFVENNFTMADLFSKTNKNIENYFKTASEKLGCSLYLSKPWKCFQENISWKQVLTCGLKDRSKGIVCGGKGTGKSTFLRYYINKLLARGPLLLIDLDPGQCEFTVAGNISASIVTEPLLGPNFTHLKTPEMMLNIGAINTMDNPRRYAAAIEVLITHCSRDERLANMPWIINTMGMCNAMGLKFICLTILHTQPSFLLQIDSKAPKKRFEYNLYSHTIRQLYFEKFCHDSMFRNVKSPKDLDYKFFMSHHTDNSVRNNFSLAPRDERYLNYLAYFGELLNMTNEGLLEIVPYEVNLKHLSIGSNVKINKDSLMKVLNGKVIALCQQADADKKLFTLADKPLRCHGHGLIRGVDWEKGVLYIISPIAANVLPIVNTVVYSDWVPELRGLERQLPAGVAVPYRTATPYQQRQLMFSPKRRFNPLQLIKMSRNA